jgi:hypothetical protein
MKTRTSFEICLPLVLCVAACLASLPTLVLSIIWLTLGVCSIGHRPLEELPAEGVSRQWLRGPRTIVLWFYHLAWWPWYMRFELREIVARAGEAIESGCHQVGRKSSRRATKRRIDGGDKQG